MTGGRDRVGVQVLADDRNRVVAREWGLPGEHLVEQGAEGVEVALRAGRLAERLLGREIGHGPHQRAPADAGAPLRRCQAEVAEPGMPVVVEPDVRGLQVAMDDSARVRVLEGAGDVHRDLDRPRHLEPPPVRGQQRLHVAPRHVFADDVGAARVLSGVMHPDHVGMVSELAHRVGLAASTRLDRGGDAGGVEQGHRDLLVGARVLRQVDPLAPTLPEELLEPVAAAGNGLGRVGRQDPRCPLPRRRAIGSTPGDSFQVGAARIAEPCPLAVLVAARRAAHTSKLAHARPPLRDLCPSWVYWSCGCANGSGAPSSVLGSIS